MLSVVDRNVFMRHIPVVTEMQPNHIQSPYIAPSSASMTVCEENFPILEHCHLLPQSAAKRQWRCIQF